ncbi:MAG TPA: hypothetical protein PKY88_13100 [Anaerohalosphaeraceae bacterium]|nr:hypothetical protein [Anaerohalosphaeraceae bacterium]
MTTAVDIADAVVSELNNSEAGFSLDFTAERILLPYFEQKDLVSLKVTVVPSEVSYSSLSRSSVLAEYGIDVAVQKKVNVGSDDDIETLIGLTKEIADYLRRKKLALADYACWARSQISPLYSVEHLLDHKVFTSVVKISYKTAE